MRRIFLMSSVLFVAPFVFGESGEASAQCVATQDCASLGYTEASCPNGGIKCPFGNTWNCKTCDPLYKYTCNGTGYTGGDGPACGGKYKSCKCAAGYIWNGAACSARAVLGQCTGYAKNCAIGQILNSDGTCTTDKVSGKTPIGVVIYISSSSDKCGYAMTASPIQRSIWSTGFGYTGASNSTEWKEVIKDFNVSGNMTKIIQASGGDSSKYPAAYAALNYAPSATPASKGKWALPTAGILNSLYTNLNAINNAISKVGGTQLTGDEEHIWSSSEYNAWSSVWCFCTGTYQGAMKGGVEHYGKNNNDLYVRPVIAF